MNKRKIIFLFITIIFLASNYAYSEERYYYGFDTKIPITIIPNKVALYQEDDTTENQVHNYISQHQLTTAWKHNRCRSYAQTMEITIPYGEYYFETFPQISTLTPGAPKYNWDTTTYVSQEPLRVYFIVAKEL